MTYYAWIIVHNSVVIVAILATFSEFCVVFFWTLNQIPPPWTLKVYPTFSINPIVPQSRFEGKSSMKYHYIKLTLHKYVCKKD